MRISILQGSETGTVVYTETQNPTTNANGLVSIEFGEGIGFDTINWANGPYFIKTETAVVAPLTTYTITGTNQLLSVPYSLHAKTAENISNNGTIGSTLRHNGTGWIATKNLFNNGSNIGIGDTLPGYPLSILEESGTSIYTKSKTSYNTIDIDAFSGDAAIRFSKNGSLQWNIRNKPGTDDFEIYEMGGGGSRMIIQNTTGKFGIGTLTPTGTLSVIGTFAGKDSAAIYANNTDTMGVGLYCEANSYQTSAIFNQKNYVSGSIAKFFDGGTTEIVKIDNYPSTHMGRISMYGNHSGTTGGGFVTGSSSWGLVMGDINSLGEYNFIANFYHPTSTTTSFLPWFNNSTALGSLSYKWTAVYATNGTIQTSDETMKENIKSISYGLDAVMNLKPVSYNWKDKKAKIGNGTNLGFMAQDLEKVLPDVVVHEKISQQEIDNAKRDKGIDITNTDTYGVKYSEIIPVLVKAIQEQQSIIDKQQKQIDELNLFIKGK